MKSLVHKKAKGSITALTLLIGIVLITIGISSLTLGYQARIRSIRTAQKLAARAAADAGLTKALYLMNEQIQITPWNDGSLPLTVNEALPEWNAVFSYTVTGDTSSGYTITSTGNFNGIEKSVEAKLRVASYFEFAVFGDDSVDLKAKADIDWINNDTGDNPLLVATNSTDSGAITLKNGSYVNGDVFAGLNGDTDTAISNNGANITGTVSTLSEKFILNQVSVPSYLTSMSSGGNLTTNTTISSSGRYNKINLKKNKTITIDGNIELYITGDVTLGNGAELTINSDSMLSLFIDGDIEGKNGSSFNNESEDSTSFKIFGSGTDQDMIFKNSSDLYGAIYAPDAYVEFKNSADAYGSIICEEFEQKNSSDFYYDVNLRNVDYGDVGIRFVIAEWREL